MLNGGQFQDPSEGEMDHFWAHIAAYQNKWAYAKRRLNRRKVGWEMEEGEELDQEARANADKAEQQHIEENPGSNSVQRWADLSADADEKIQHYTQGGVSAENEEVKNEEVKNEEVDNEEVDNEEVDNEDPDRMIRYHRTMKNQFGKQMMKPQIPGSIPFPRSPQEP